MTGAESAAVRAVAYLRVSSDRTGEALAVSRQRDDVRDLMARRDWRSTGEFVDNDTSASGRQRRPQFEALIEAICRDEVDAVVAWALDRLARTARDRLALVEACRDHSVKIALVRGSDIDPTTPAGRLTAGVLGEVAQHEIDQKSDRQRRAALQAAAQGRRVGGRRPFGYEMDGMTIRPDEAAAIRRAYADFIEGVPLARIARDWNAAGLRTGQTSWAPSRKGSPTIWKSDTVRLVLRNARNIGVRTHRGEEIGPARWPPLVDEETYRAAVAVLNDPSRRSGGKGRNGRQLLTGVALCGVCGETVNGTGAYQSRPLYRCRTGRHLGRRRDVVDEFVTRVVLAYLERNAEELIVDHARPDAAELRDEAAALRSRLDSLATEFADGDLTASQLRTATERLRTRLTDVESRQADAGRAALFGPLLNSGDAQATWDALDTDRRRAVIDALAVVRLHPIGKGTRTFRPESIGIEWRSE